MKLVLSLIFFLFCFNTLDVHAKQLRIAVASNFTQTMKPIVDNFEQETRIKIKTSFASSGKLYAQIRHGAPFQLFFSADQDKPEKLIQLGLADKTSQYTYAIGQLVLWSAKPDSEKSVKERLKKSQFKRLALANSKLAPYGMAAKQVLQNLNLLGPSRSKWVQGENISQTYQFIATGNAQLGFVARSQLPKDALTNPAATWLVPHDLYSPVKQDVVILESAKSNPAALRFMQFIRSAKVKNIIESSGYSTLTNN